MAAFLSEDQSFQTRKQIGSRSQVTYLVKQCKTRLKKRKKTKTRQFPTHSSPRFGFASSPEVDPCPLSRLACCCCLSSTLHHIYKDHKDKKNRERKKTTTPLRQSCTQTSKSTIFIVETNLQQANEKPSHTTYFQKARRKYCGHKIPLWKTSQNYSIQENQKKRNSCLHPPKKLDLVVLQN